MNSPDYPTDLTLELTWGALALSRPSQIRCINCGQAPAAEFNPLARDFRPTVPTLVGPTQMPDPQTAPLVVGGLLIMHRAGRWERRRQRAMASAP
jgi:hypothetical protein